MRHRNKWLPGITTTKQFVLDLAIKMCAVTMSEKVNQTDILYFTYIKSIHNESIHYEMIHFS